MNEELRHDYDVCVVIIKLKYQINAVEELQFRVFVLIGSSASIDNTRMILVR